MFPILYQASHAILLLLAAPFLLLFRGRHYLATLSGRLGRTRPAPFPDAAGPAPPPTIWIHAVSVGEVNVARVLLQPLQRLRGPLRVVVTTVTPTGQALAQKLWREDKHVCVAYLPFDLAPPLRSFLRQFDPQLLVLVEGEYWPLLLHTMQRQGTPIVVVNGRISDRSFPRLQRVQRWFPPAIQRLLGPVDRFAVQSDADASRLQELGVDPARIRITGNLKYEQPRPQRATEAEQVLVSAADGRAVVLAGSTMAGEDEILLDAFEQLDPATRSSTLLAIAPRHPERWPGVARLIQERGFSLLRRSEIEHADDYSVDAANRPDIFLLDSIGELAALYRLAAIAFVGGTLSNTGGHNPLEPALFARPIVVGPSMHNFREIARDFDADRAWQRVDGARELRETLEQWLRQPEVAARFGVRAQQRIEQGEGATRRTLDWIAEVLPAGAEAAAGASLSQ